MGRQSELQMTIQSTVENVGDVALAWASRTPDTAAIIDELGELTFRALEDAVRRACRSLTTAGIGAGNVVCVALHSSPLSLHIAATLALARIGAIQLVIDPSETAATVFAPLAQRYRVAAVLTDQNITAPSMKIIAPDVKWLDPLAPVPNRIACSQATHLPWMISRSSGTTGSPKSMPFTHALELRRNSTIPANTVARQGERAATLMNPWFYVAIRRMLHCLGEGGTWVALPRNFTAEELFSRINQLNISVVHATPSHVQVLLPSATANVIRLPKLRMLRIGTGALTERVVRTVMSSLTPNLYISYSCNECGNLATAGPDDLRLYPLTVGRLSPEVELELVSEDGRKVGTGEVGEIRVRTPYMIDRYFDDAAETKRRFRDGWYYPGDAAVMDKDGRIFLKGRTDDLLNFGGALVAPQEIEAALLRHPDVSDAAVYGMPSEQYQDVPWAAVVLARPVASDELTNHCVKLIGWKTPAAFLFVQSLPRNAIGKVLRRTLRQTTLEYLEKNAAQRSSQ